MAETTLASRGERPWRLFQLRNVADAICILRMVLAPAAALLMALHAGPITEESLRRSWEGASLTTFVALTDLVDGIAARRLGSNPWGSSLDAMADKWLFCWWMVPVWVHGLFSPGFMLLIVARENLATLLRCFAHKHGLQMQTSFFGKMKSTVLIMAVGMAYWEERMYPEYKLHCFLFTHSLMAGLAVYRQRREHAFRPMTLEDRCLSIGGLAMIYTCFFIKIRTILVAMQGFYAFGSFVQYMRYGGAAVVSKWMEAEGRGSKAVSLLGSVGVPLIVYPLLWHGDTSIIAALIGAVVLSANLVAIFLYESLQALEDVQKKK